MKIKFPSGYGALYLSAILFAVCSAFVKTASAYIPGLLISSIRFATGLLLAVPMALVLFGKLEVKKFWLVLFRGLFGSISMILGYLAISFTAPGRAIVLSNTYPVWVAIIAGLLFHEKITLKTVISLVLCSAGAILIVRDGSGSSLVGDLFALLSAIFAGIAVNMVRRASFHDNPFILYMSPCLFGLPIGLAFGGIPPVIPAEGIFFAIIVGIFAFLAQIFMTRGYKTVSAGSGSIVFYFETLLTVAIGFLFYGEKPNLPFFAGFAVILIGLVLNNLKIRKPAHA